MFNYTPESSSCELNQVTLALLEAIDAFQYPLLNPTYQSLGDLHATLAEVKVDYDIKIREKIVKVTIGKLKELLVEWKKRNREIEEHNSKVYSPIGDNNFGDIRAKPIPDSEYKDVYLLESVLEEHTGESDDTEIEMKIPYSLAGYYSRTSASNQGYIVLLYKYDESYAIATTYIHEMMHAFYDADLSTPMNGAEYAEEPLAECGMLHFVQAFVKAHPKYRDLLPFALKKVQDKQKALGIVHYGFGEYLFQKYPHIEWEKLMRDAHSKVATATAPYTELQAMLQGVYPEARRLPEVAEKVYEVLTGNDNGTLTQSLLQETIKKNEVSSNSDTPSQKLREKGDGITPPDFDTYFL